MIIKDFIDHVRHAKIDRENAARRSKAGMFALGVSIGCTVGAVAGVLLAPRSGKKTRDDVVLRGGEAWEKIKDNVSTNGHRLVHVLKEKGACIGAAVEKESEAVEESLQDLSAHDVKTDARKS